MKGGKASANSSGFVAQFWEHDRVSGSKPQGDARRNYSRGNSNSSTSHAAHVSSVALNLSTIMQATTHSAPTLNLTHHHVCAFCYYGSHGLNYPV